MKSLTVMVNERHIAEGIRSYSFGNPVVVALFETRKGLDQRMFSYEDGKITVFNMESLKPFDLDLPPEVVQWMKDFEEGKPVKPIIFSVDTP